MSLLPPLLVVLLATFACGWIARRLGQARVIGEMIGGLLLGPTILGRVAPTAWHMLFTPASLGAFDALSTVGLVLYLFLIGIDLDASHLRRQRNAAVLATLASLLLPFALAVAVSSSVARKFGTGTAGTVAFTLFLGISLSITAFPVLARILEERGLTATPLGVTSLLCAAADDVCAWMLLALAMTFLPHGSGSLSIPVRLLLFAAYLLVMFAVARGSRWLAKQHANAKLSHEAMAATVLVVLASSAATDALGLHPLFGAFVAGLCFPRVTQWQHALKDRLEVPVTSLLLPFFFALTGLRTRMDLLHGNGVLPWMLLILLLAVGGKIGGGVIAGLSFFETWRNALALGAMLNTRGLVELIVLNIAYTQGVFSPTLFTLLVVMALATTLMTSPLLNLLGIGGTAHTSQAQ